MKKIKYYVLGVAVLTTTSFFGCKDKNATEPVTDNVVVENSSSSQSVVTLLDVDTFAMRLDSIGDVQLVDVRTPEEVAEGHLEGAVNFCINTDGFEAKIETLDKSKAVYVYCRSGGRSARAANLMKEAGFKEVYDLDGGITAWMAAGKEVKQ